MALEVEKIAAALLGDGGNDNPPAKYEDSIHRAVALHMYELGLQNAEDS